MTFTNILFHGFLSSQSSDFHNFASIFTAFMEVLPHSSIQEILPLMLFGGWARRPCRWRKFLISWLLETSLMAQWVKNPRARQEAQKTQSDPWFRKISWRKKWQPTPVLLPEKIPRMEEPGGLQSMGSQRLRLAWAASVPWGRMGRLWAG